MKRLICLAFLSLTLSYSPASLIAQKPEAEFISSKDFLKLSYELWADSQFGQDPKETERAVWIVVDPQGVYHFIKWRYSASSRSATWEGPQPSGTIAQIHTHPAKVDPKPSSQDRFLARRLNLPVLCVSGSGIWESHPSGEVTRVASLEWYRQLKQIPSKSNS